MKNYFFFNSTAPWDKKYKNYHIRFVLKDNSNTVTKYLINFQLKFFWLHSYAVMKSVILCDIKEQPSYSKVQPSAFPSQYCFHNRSSTTLQCIFIGFKYNSSTIIVLSMCTYFQRGEIKSYVE